jgi:hypothetical protein
MTNALVSTSSSFSTSSIWAALLAAALCAAPALAQESTAPEPASDAPAAATAPQTETTSPGVRIVRLSQVTGEVQLDRNTGHGFESAFANLPIVQGSRLRTENGVAEVEFEDNSSLRLTPNSVVEFPMLTMNASGVRSSTVYVVQGVVYVSLTKSKDSNVSLAFGKETLALSPAAHVELALNGSKPRLDVLDGTVAATNGATTTTVGRKQALVFDPTNTNAPTLLSKNEKGPYDAWDKQETDYHNRFAPTNANYAGTPYAYGLTDMNYYGSFIPMAGCGMMWQPYLASAGWSPFANGIWAWYPGAGYSWVSPYPWGWTAFHSGSWNYCPGAGWGWQPNSTWNGLQNAAAVSVKQPGRLIGIRPPLEKPRPVGSTMVLVNEKPLVFSKLNEDTFTFRKDSAGLGVPRTTFGKLDHISASVAQHGMVNRDVYYESASTGRPVGNVGNAGMHNTMPSAGHAPAASGPSSSSGFAGGASHGGGFSSGSSGTVGGGSFSSGASGGGAAAAGGHH